MEQENTTVDTFQLYSQKSIAIATFLGGPIAAGILVRTNFINLGQDNAGKTALIIGIFATILVFVGIFSLPEEIIDKIPNSLIPFIYTGIIYLIIEKYQGLALDEHKTNDKPFYSAWKATGIGMLCGVILLIVIGGYVLLIPNNFDAEKYDKGITHFQKNEKNAIQLYSLLDNNSTPYKVISHLENVGVPAWKENLSILDDLDTIPNLPDQFKQQNDKLREYSKLGIEKFELIKKAIIEKTEIYDTQIEILNNKIEKILESL
jgi:hypothetical protein